MKLAGGQRKGSPAFFVKIRFGEQKGIYEDYVYSSQLLCGGAFAGSISV